LKNLFLNTSLINELFHTVIVHITFIILTVFFRIYKKDRCTQESRSWRWEYKEGRGFRYLYTSHSSSYSIFQDLHQGDAIHYQCDDCGKLYTSRKALGDHTRSVH
jgi:hypothetical protein